MMQRNYGLVEGASLTVQLTHEGVIVDLIDAHGEVIGTLGWMASELAELINPDINISSTPTN